MKEGSGNPFVCHFVNAGESVQTLSDIYVSEVGTVVEGAKKATVMLAKFAQDVQERMDAEYRAEVATKLVRAASKYWRRLDDDYQSLN